MLCDTFDEMFSSPQYISPHHMNMYSIYVCLSVHPPTVLYRHPARDPRRVTHGERYSIALTLCTYVVHFTFCTYVAHIGTSALHAHAAPLEAPRPSPRPSRFRGPPRLEPLITHICSSSCQVMLRRHWGPLRPPLLPPTHSCPQGPRCTPP